MNAVGAAGEYARADRETRRVDCLLCDANKKVGSVCRVADLLQVLLRIIYSNSSIGEGSKQTEVEYMSVSNSDAWWAFLSVCCLEFEQLSRQLFGCAGC
jgi:hypothetical protein